MQLFFHVAESGLGLCQDLFNTACPLFCCIWFSSEPAMTLARHSIHFSQCYVFTWFLWQAKLTATNFLLLPLLLWLFWFFFFFDFVFQCVSMGISKFTAICWLQSQPQYICGFNLLLLLTLGFSAVQNTDYLLSATPWSLGTVWPVPRNVILTQ